MISSAKFYAVMRSLSRKGLLKEHPIAQGGQGLPVFLELTPLGCDELGVQPKPHLTRGGNFVTDVLVVKLSEHLKRIILNSRVSIEIEYLGKWTDILVELLGAQPFALGVELEASDMNIESNVTKAVERLDFTIEACGSEAIKQKAEEIVAALPASQQEKLGVCLVTKLLRCQKLSNLIDSEVLKARGL
jgi:hypothetical protein